MKVVLTATTSKFDRAMTWSGKKVKQFRGAVVKVGAALRAMATAAGIAAAAIAAIVFPFKKMFDLAAGIEETASKFRTVFGPEATATVSKFLDTFANKAGLTKTQAQALVATTGAIAQGLGFTQKASGEAAIAITKLAGDLSSFNNIPTEETLMAINSALTGEREQLKRLGIVILEADVQKKALTLSGKALAATLTTEDKAMASLALIAEKAGVAVGDLDRTSGSAANRAKNLGAQFREIRDALATALMPAFEDWIKRLQEAEGEFGSWKEKILANSAMISAWATLTMESVRVVISVFVNLGRTLFNIGQLFGDVAEMARALVKLDFKRVGEEFEKFKGNVGDIGNAMESARGVAADWEKAALRVLRGEFETLVRLGGETSNLTQGLEDATTAVEEMAESVETLGDKFKSLGESASSDFLGRMTSAVQGGKNVFDGFFTWMKNKIIELALRWAVFQSIMQISGGKYAAFGEMLTGFPAGGGGVPEPLTADQMPSPRLALPGISHKGINRLMAQPTGGGGMVVNQNVNFTISAIDGRSASRFIQEQGATIAGVMAEATRNSTAYRRQLLGG